MLLIATVLAIAVQLAGTGLVRAQSPAASAADNELSEVVVTGSRLIQNGNMRPTPVTVVAIDDMKNAAPGSMADALAQIPQFRSSTRPGTFLNSQNSTGAFLNLRGLGSSRTLVLLDGRRTPPTTTEGRTDINTYPQLLMKRVDIVTGGASAAYGSDAVSGVVNFILDTEFTGIKGEASGGISSNSDNQAQALSLAYGTEVRRRPRPRSWPASTTATTAASRPARTAPGTASRSTSSRTRPIPATAARPTCGAPASPARSSAKAA